MQEEGDDARGDRVAGRGIYGQREMQLAAHEIHIGDLDAAVGARLDALAVVRPARPNDDVCQRLDEDIAQIKARLAPGSAASKAREAGVRARFQGTSQHAVAQHAAEREATAAQQLALVRARSLHCLRVPVV